MTNLFKKAASLFGRWTGLNHRTEIDPFAHSMADEAIDLAQPADSSDFPPLDAPTRDWNDSMNTPAQSHDSEAIIASGPIDASFSAFPPAPDQPIAAGVLAGETVVSATTADLNPVAPIAATHTEAPAEEIKAPIEHKPISTSKPSVTFTQLYELISTEVNKRTDNTVTVYERLLTASREELNATRKSNRIAWSIGGVMTAVAAFGAIWSAGEVAATRVEVGSLKQQVATGQKASIERDQLRSDLLKTREASAKIEIDALKARLDQALVVSSDRDRLRADLEAARKARQDVETELKVARAAATQPISEARPASGRVLADRTDKFAGAERPDAWSTLLNGKDDH